MLSFSETQVNASQGAKNRAKVRIYFDCAKYIQ